MRLAGKHAVITGGAASGLRMWAISRLSSAQTERGGHLNVRTTRSSTRLRPLLMRWCKLLQLYQAHPQTDPREGAQPHIVPASMTHQALAGRADIDVGLRIIGEVGAGKGTVASI